MLKGGHGLRCVHLGTAEIQKNRVKAPLFDHGQRFAGIGDDVAFTTQSCQQEAEDIADGGFVLDDENGAQLVTLVQITSMNPEKPPGPT